MPDLIRSARQLARGLRRSPLFTITTVITLALGIGASVAIFSVVQGVLLEPLPYEQPEQLLGLWYTAPGLGFDQINQSAATYFTLSEQADSFSAVGLWDNDTGTVTGIGDPEEVSTMMVTAGVLPMLGVTPQLGRLFNAEDDAPGSALTILLSHASWQSWFGGDKDVLGQTLTLSGRAREIIGVLPPGFRLLSYDPALYYPARFDRSEAMMGKFNYQGIGRLAPGATIEQANAEAERLIWVATDEFPGGLTRKMLEEAQFGATLHPLKNDLVGNVGEVLWLLFGTVGLVLLIACANAANLFLVRGEGRQRELALRTALGAERRGILATLLGESLMLAGLAGLLGLGLAGAGLQLLRALAPSTLPRIDEISIDGTVLLFAVAVSLFAGMLFGVFPALRLASLQLASALREGGRGASTSGARLRLRNALVVVQVGLALVLLVASGLLFRSFQAMRHVSPGFSAPEEVLTFRVTLPFAEVEEEVDAANLQERILGQLANLPGVVSVGASSSLTMDGWDSNDAVYVEDAPAEEGQIPPIRRFKFVAGDYFETMGNPVLAGRAFTWSDIHERRWVVVVTENFAREYWDDPAAAIGKRIGSGTFSDEGFVPVPQWREIVGVVGNVHDNGVDQDPAAIVYWPFVMEDFWGNELFVQRSLGYAVRAERPQLLDGLQEQARQTIWKLNPNLPLAGIRTLEEVHVRSMARTSFTVVMLAIAAAVALLLGTIGIYGMVSYVAAQRTHEMGIRQALGASRRNVGALMIRHGVALTSMGLAAGLIASALLTRWMATLLYGVEALDPLTFGAVALTLGAIATLASAAAARRTTRVSPLVALRSK